MSAATGIIYLDVLVRPFFKVFMKFPIFGFFLLIALYGFVGYLVLKSTYLTEIGRASCRERV